MDVRGQHNLKPGRILRGLPSIAFLATVITAGCMSSSRAVVSDAPATAAVSVDSGKLVVSPHAFQDVYYHVPFAAAPKLEVPDHWGKCQVVMQTETRFRVLNHTGSDLEVEWKAMGTKATPAPLPVLGPPQTREIARSTAAPATTPAVQPASLPAANSPGDGLPAEPVPVSGTR
jgi:hypothetical protein